MSLLAVEIVGSRETTISIDAPAQELLFIASGTNDDKQIRAFIETQLTPTISVTSQFFGNAHALLSELHHQTQGQWDLGRGSEVRVPAATADWRCGLQF